MIKRQIKVKVSEVESITPSICFLATNAALAALKSDLENNIPRVSSLLQKTDCNTKISEI